MRMTHDNAGGPIAIRGYLVQTLVALLEIAHAEPPFIEITLEPDHANEQFDYVWSNAQGTFAVQVKSTINEFQKSAVEDWAKKLEAARKNETCSLMLVGNFHTSLAKIDKVGAVSIRKKNLDLTSLYGQASHQLAKLIEAQSLDAGTAEEREMVTHSLVSRLLTYSTTRQPLTHDAFIKLLTSWFKEAPRHQQTPDISRIIKYAPEALIGRGTETQLLNDAWYQAVSGKSKRPLVLTFVALGGEGKTSLVAKWAADLAHDNWPGCEAVFAWSFYSQGTNEQSTASSDLFLKEALEKFGDAEMANSARHASDKGKRLAQLVGAKRALLILDGVEPLQYAPTSPTPGEFKDQGIATLLKVLAVHSHGLCVVTTRYSIPDLKVHWEGNAPQIPLRRLSKEAGVDLLKSLGVNGTQPEFEKLVEDVQGHALTLNLLGSYLRDAHAGDIRKRDLVKLEEADAEEQGGHAFRVMDAYVQWFENGGKDEEENKKGQRALAVLRLQGLFDRPVSSDCFNALLKAPAIPNLTELLVEKNEAKRNIALIRLRDAKLLTVNRNGAGTLLSLDAHPLLREYFAKQLREQYPVSRREAHRRIYKHLISTTHESNQPTLEELQPLYQAVAHGCLAGMQQETCNKIYRDRINRGGQHYSTKKLGAYGSDLGAVACFFELKWSHISPELNRESQAWLLNQAAYRLGALGRLVEAIDPIRAGMEARFQLGQLGQASVNAINLSDIELTLGEMDRALEDSRLGMFYADVGSVENDIRSALATHANVLHQAGHPTEASTHFRKAEDIRGKHILYLLHSVMGFYHSDLMLDVIERASWQIILGLDGFFATADENARSSYISSYLHDIGVVSLRTEKTLQAVEAEGKDILSPALDHLTLARVALYGAILKNSSLVPCRDSIQHAMDGLSRSGDMRWLPHGLLTRALLRSLEGRLTGPDSAQAYLDETMEIAERGPMQLFMADIYLHRARLFFRVTPYPWHNPDGTSRSARQDLAEARRLIEKHGYWRRKEELENAELLIGE